MHAAVASESSVNEPDRGQRAALVAVAAGAGQHQVRQSVDTDSRPGQHMVDRIVDGQVRVAVEAVCTEDVL